ncbi:unnamed protein product [Phytomonas sp. Hart1]|nr:unnamed protein product [Phytomonas sp. Hart1]|eukprot:CCW71882.1 unnamed protein product [Phytomonas sp. isolate Hart1]
MLYGGVRVGYLSQRPFPLHYIKSEELPSPSLQRERHDLGLEMQLPKDLHGYDQLDRSIQPQVDPTHGEDGAGEEGFDMGEYFSTAFHPERHHNSSPPYRAHDTNNVMGLRVFPLNMGIRLRVEGVRIRTKDCWERLQDAKLCAQRGVPLQYPLPFYKRAQMKDEVKNAGLKPSQALAHLRGGPSHPPSAELSIFTRPQDHPRGGGGGGPSSGPSSTREAALAYFRERHRRGGGDAPTPGPSSRPDRRWTPLQMLKPIPHTWSPGIRSCGTRGPAMQLLQERLDRKGFGWKRKSRSLWQQDIDTAGFRPHRFF